MRKFKFFESKVLSRTEPGIAELTQNELITATGGGGNVYFGDAHGNVTVASSSFTPVAILHAHASHVSYLKYLPSENILVTIGDGTDVDFQVKGLNDNHAIFVQGSSDKVGIGFNAPAEKLSVMSAINKV